MRAALPNHREQSAARVVVFFVLFQMRGEFLNALGEDGNLHFRRAAVRLVYLSHLDDFLLFSLGEH